MIEGAKRARWSLRVFRRNEPGQRFLNRDERARRRRETGEAPDWMRLLNLICGIALVVAGFLFLPTPGPSYIIVLGLWMIAGQ